MHVLARNTRRVASWRAVIAWLVMIFALSSIPNEFAASAPSRIPFDKVAHFGEYSVLAVLLVGAASRTSRSNGRLALVSIAAVVLASAYGASDEFHQRYVHGRDPDVKDWIADTIGAAAGAGVAVAVLRRGKDSV